MSFTSTTKKRVMLLLTSQNPKTVNFFHENKTLMFSSEASFRSEIVYHSNQKTKYLGKVHNLIMVIMQDVAEL